MYFLKNFKANLGAPEKMSWENAHLNLCKLLETELRDAQLL